MGRFSTKRRASVREGWVTVPDLWARCRAAAKLVLRSDRYSGADREDLAAHLLTHVWREASEAHAVATVLAPVSTSLRGDGAVSYGAKLRQKSKDAGTNPLAQVAAIHPRIIRGGKLYGLASNERRAMDLRRERDEREALTAARMAGFSPHVADTDEELRGRHPYSAHVLALEILDALGMDSDRGPAYSAAYAAARANVGMEDAPTVARELGMTHAALRQHLARAAKRIPSVSTYGEAEHADALHVPDRGSAAKGRTPILAQDPRTRPAFPAPVKEARTRTVRPWNGKRRAGWTSALTPGAHARYTLAAQRQRARVAHRPTADRKRLRSAAGLKSPAPGADREA